MFVTAVLLLAALAGCAPGQPAAPAPAPAQPQAAAPTAAAAAPATAVAAIAVKTGKDVKDLKIGYIYLTLAQPYYQAHSKQVEQYAQELGFTLVERDGKMDAAVQTNAI